MSKTTKPKLYFRGKGRPKVFPFRGGNTRTLKQVISGGQGNRVYDINGISCTQASQAGGRGAKTGLYIAPVLTPDRPNKRQNGRRFKENGEPSFTLTSQDKHGIYINKTVRTGGRGSLTKKHNRDTHLIDGKIRRLTPKECERLQGFPDCWTDGISDTQRYKTLGNAVTVNVIIEIMKKLST